VAQLYNSFSQFQTGLLVNDNPRLVQESKYSIPLFMPERTPGRDVMVDAGSQFLPALAPSGN
jgi:hypothetical protein